MEPSYDCEGEEGSAKTALSALYASTGWESYCGTDDGCSSLTSWGLFNPCSSVNGNSGSQWSSVTCTGWYGGEVTAIFPYYDPPSTFTSGTQNLPTELALLSSLTQLNLAGAALKGTLPTQVLQ